MSRITVDLITGFLGAGKTTFIHEYLRYLKDQGQRVRIIENEYGDVAVDSLLLKDEDCDIQDLTGLCMCCVGKQELIHMLQESGSCHYCDRIIIEPSGIYDVDEFFEVMSLPRVQEVCEIGCIITVADPYDLEQLTEEAKYLMFTQLLSSGTVVLSKTQTLTQTQVDQAIEGLNELMRARGCEGGLPAELVAKPWTQLTEDDYEDMIFNGYNRFVHDRDCFSHAEVFQSVNIQGDYEDEAEIRRLVETIFSSEDCGRIYRIKGCCVDSKGLGYEVNCTRQTRSIRVTDTKENLLVIIGQKVRIRGLRAMGFQCRLA